MERVESVNEAQMKYSPLYNGEKLLPTMYERWMNGLQDN